MQHDQLVILLHSSKTMRASSAQAPRRQPALIREAKQLANLLKSLPAAELQNVMHISGELAAKTKIMVDAWSEEGKTLAIDSFIGDIYSGLRAGELTAAERDYADSCLWILSGLYGYLRPYDAISPYRLEMAYKLPGAPFKSLYEFWGDTIAAQLPERGTIVNVSSAEYTKVILPFVDAKRVVTPQFLTVNPKTGEPGFTAVHAKIARGAFARWLITTKITDPKRFKEFADLGYRFDETRSTADSPVFVCQQFEGLGLSIRLK